MSANRRAPVSAEPSVTLSNATQQLAPPFLKIITRSDFESNPELDKSFTPDLLCFALGTCSATGLAAHVNHGDSTAYRPGHPPQVRSRATSFYRTPHLTGSQGIDVSRNDKLLLAHQLYALFGCNRLIGSSSTTLFMNILTSLCTR